MTSRLTITLEPERSIQFRKLIRTTLAGIGESLPALLAALFPILFIPTLTDAYVLPRSALAVGGGCLLFAWALATAGTALGGLGRAWLAVAAAAVLATLFSISPALSVIGSYARYESLLTRLAYLLLFAGGAWLAATPQARSRTLTAFVGGCVVASLEALYEAATGYPPRPDGNLGQANLLGGLLAMAIPIVCSRVPRAPAWLLALVPLLAGIAVTASRSGWLGAAAGTALLLPLLASSRRRRAAFLAGAAAALTLVLAVIVLSPLASLNGDTGSARLHVWKDSLSIVSARPLTGLGEDALGLEFSRHLTGNWEPGATFDRVHQAELDLLAAQGILGLAACTWFFTAWLLAAWRRVWSRTRPVEPALVSIVAAWAGFFVFVQLNFDWAPVTAPAWLLAGVGWAAVRDPQPSRRPPGWAIAAGIGASACAAIAFGVLPVLADSAASHGDPAGAVRLDPLQARYHRLLGETLSGSIDGGTLARARDQLRQSSELGAYDATVFIELGDLDAKLGDGAAALVDYRRAAELDPYNPSIRERVRQTEGK